MKFNRRNVLIGLGSIAAGAGTLAGTGAFTSVTATRDATINVAGDAGALLSIQAASGPNANQYVSTKDNGEVAIDLSTGTGSGVNPNAVTEVDDLLLLVNQGTQPVDVWFTDDSDAVTFRTDEDSIDGPGNSVLLEVGEQIIVGATIDTRDTDAEQVLSSVTIHAGKTSPAQGTSPRQLYVDNNAAGDAPNVYTTIKDAIKDASGGETINVAASSTPYSGFDVDKRVKIVGENAFPSEPATGSDTYVDSERVTLSAQGAVLSQFRITGAYSGSEPIVEVTQSATGAALDGINLDGVEGSVGDLNSDFEVLASDVSVTNSRLSRGSTLRAAPGLSMGQDKAEFGITGGVVQNNTFEDSSLGAILESGQSITVTSNTFDFSTDWVAQWGSNAAFIIGTGFGPVPQDATATVQNNGEVIRSTNSRSGFVDLFVPGGGGLTSALDNANQGADVYLPSTTFEGAIDVTTDDLTLRGVSSSDTVIDASGVGSGYGIDVTGSGVSLEGFTLLGPQNTSNGYGIKISDRGNRILEDLLVRDVKVVGSGRSEIDFNYCSNIRVEDVVVDGQETAGVGLGFTECQNITIDSITTKDNNWGGIGLYTYSPTGDTYERDTTDVTLTGSNSFDGPAAPMYEQPKGSVTNVDVGDTFAVSLETSFSGLSEYLFYFETQADAEEFVDASDDLTDSNTTISTL